MVRSTGTVLPSNSTLGLPFRDGDLDRLDLLRDVGPGEQHLASFGILNHVGSRSDVGEPLVSAVAPAELGAVFPRTRRR